MLRPYNEKNVSRRRRSRNLEQTESSGGGAVAGALEDAKIGGPGADSFAVLVGHDAGELVEMREVVSGPGGEELGERNGAESGVAAAKVELVGAEIQCAEFG